MEFYHAETTDMPSFILSYEELKKKWKTIPEERLSYRKHSYFHPQWPERWVVGWDLLGQEEVAVPYTSVFMNYEVLLSVPTELRSFRCDSNGLASGNHFLEALAGALYEAMERDAITCHHVLDSTDHKISSRICIETIPFPRVREMVERFEEKEMQCFLYVQQ